MVLVGNKIDLTREVTTEEGKKLAEHFKVPFFETSAKENIGISDFIRKIISEVMESYKPTSESIKLESGSGSTSGKCKC
jgi:GTPase SAR1 family protein